MEVKFIKIGIDIDGVMNNLEEFYKSYGTKFCYENNIPLQINAHEYKLKDIFNWDKIIEKKFLNTYYDILLTRNEFLRPHTEEVMHILHKMHEVVIITARNERDLPLNTNKSMEEVTKTWLKDNNINYDYLVFSGIDKTQVIWDYKIDLMIEDNPIFLMTAAEANVKLLCFDASYNCYLQHPNILHTCSWYDLLYNICNWSGEEDI